MSKKCNFLFLVIGILYYITGSTQARRCPQLRQTRLLRTACSNSWNENSRCFYRCIQGYQVTNPASVMKTCRCTRAGCKWTGGQVYCMAATPKRPNRPAATRRPVTRPKQTQKKCPALGTSNTVRASCTRGRFEKSTCYFTCKAGKLVNLASQRRRCQCAGNRCFWTGTIATCLASPPSPARQAATRKPATRRPATARRAATGRSTAAPTPTQPAYTTPVTETSVRSNCPLPDFGRHSYQIVDSWPEGAIIRVIIKKDHLMVDDGWSALITFTKAIPKSVRVLSWTSKVVSSEGKYLRVSNQLHNKDLTGIDVFSFTLVVIGASMQEMGGYTALVAFYPAQVKKASCFSLSNNSHPSRILPQKPTQRVETSSRGIERNNRPTQQPTRRPAPPTTRPPVRRTTTTATRTLPPTTVQQQTQQQPSTESDEIRIDHAAVQRMKGRCNVLNNGLKIKNPGYSSGTKSNMFRFNADIVISGQRNMMDDWTLKVVFSKPIHSIQVWEAVLQQKSQDGRVCLFRPQSWNSQLRKDFSFLIIPEMSTKSTPKTVMFLCPSGVNPNLEWQGIFVDRRTQVQTQNQGNNVPRGQKEQLERRQGELSRRQEEIAREQRMQQEERQRQQQLERERREREQNKMKPNNQNNNNNQNRNNQNRNNNNQRNNQNRNNNNQRNNRNNNNRNRNNQNRNNQNNNNRNNNQNNNWRNNVNYNRQPQRPPAYSRPARNQPRCSGPSGYLPRNPGQTRVNYRRSPANERRPYDYNEVLSMSILFYEAQRSGKLPSTNRIPWRGDSGLRDGCDVNRDLTGGWYDAGDHVKFGFPMAWSVTTLAWGVIEFRDAYREAGEYSNVLDSLKWVTDYFIKAHASKYELYGQVGDGQADHGYWGRPEEMNMARPSHKIDRNHPGTEIAAETAAALAASSVVFRESNPKYADELVRHAVDLYEFADKFRGSYHKAIPAATAYYRSYNGFNDELVWGALWLYRATGFRNYLQDAKNKYRQFGGGGTPKMFSWDDKRAGSQVLLANFTGEAQYMNHVTNYQRFLNNPGLRTPKGLVWLDQWGSNRYAANAAFICLASAKVNGARDRRSLIKFAESQIHYMLGSKGRSYVIGYGRNPPKRPHHRGSSCPRPPSPCSWGNAFHSSSANPYTLYGALIAGPSKTDKYADDRGDYVSNEVATDYNAGFQGALAGLKYFQIKSRR